MYLNFKEKVQASASYDDATLTTGVPAWEYLQFSYAKMSVLKPSKGIQKSEREVYQCKKLAKSALLASRMAA